MKIALLLFCSLTFSTIVFSVTGCETTQRQQVKTLESIGVAAKLTVDSAAILLAEGKISVERFQKIAAFYDNVFQPAFRIAVINAEGNLKKPSTLELANKLAQLSSFLNQ